MMRINYKATERVIILNNKLWLCLNGIGKKESNEWGCGTR